MTALTHEQVQKILRAGTQPEGIEKVGFVEHLAHCRQCQSYQRLVRELSTDLPALYPVAHFTERQIRQKAAASKSVLEPRFTVARAWHSLRSAALVAIPLLMIIALGVLAWKLIPVRPAAPVPVTQTPTQLISSTPAPTEVTGTQRSVSPDGQFIAVFYPDNPRVEIIDATGTVVVQYPAPSEWIMLGTWSPDSRHFTFWVGGKSGSLQADGLPFYGMDIPSGQTHQLSPATIVNLTWQSWSPDGKSLVFTDGNYRSAQFNKWLSLYNTNTGQTVVLVPMET